LGIVGLIDIKFTSDKKKYILKLINSREVIHDRSEIGIVEYFSILQSSILKKEEFCFLTIKIFIF
jgi:hypothetical protein